MIEYKIVMLSPAPDTAKEELNKLAKEGWIVITSYEGNRVILERSK